MATIYRNSVIVVLAKAKDFQFSLIKKEFRGFEQTPRTKSRTLLETYSLGIASHTNLAQTLLHSLLPFDLCDDCHCRWSMIMEDPSISLFRFARHEHKHGCHGLHNIALAGSNVIHQSLRQTSFAQYIYKLANQTFFTVELKVTLN
jgi:hypothetical protein